MNNGNEWNEYINKYSVSYIFKGIVKTVNRYGYTIAEVKRDVERYATIITIEQIQK